MWPSSRQPLIRGCDGPDEVVNVVVAVAVNDAMVRFGCACSHRFYYVVVNDAVDIGVDAFGGGCGDGIGRSRVCLEQW